MQAASTGRDARTADLADPRPGNHRREPLRTDKNYLALAPLARDLREEIERRLAGRTGLDVLDVGCGDQPYRPWLEAHLGRYVGLDIEPAAGVDVVGHIESLPFDDGSFDVVMSSIGAMFAPHHLDVADELVRVCRPGGTIGLLSWTPEGMIGALFRVMGPFAPPPPPGAQPPPLWGGEDHLRELFGERVDFRTLQRDTLEVTAFERPHEYGEHFKGLYGPTIAARANAVRNGQEAEFDAAVNDFCDEWNLGTPEQARFEQEYLLAVGTRA